MASCGKTFVKSSGLVIAIDAAGPIEKIVGAVLRVAFLWLGLFGGCFAVILRFIFP
jgi:hypothetical protein